MGRPRNTTLEDRILELLLEWSPQHLTAEELALLIGGGTASTTVLAIAHRLEEAGRVRIDPGSHFGHAGRGRPSHRLFAQ